LTVKPGAIAYWMKRCAGIFLKVGCGSNLKKKS
jgi:hypothetical protein